MLERLIRAGMNVARLNFSHGDFSGHADRIARIRAAEEATGRRVAIMADLPGPKMRVGAHRSRADRPARRATAFTLTTAEVVGTSGAGVGLVRPPAQGGEGRRSPLPERRPDSADGGRRGRRRRPLPRHGRRRAAVAQGPEPARASTSASPRSPTTTARASSSRWLTGWTRSASRSSRPPTTSNRCGPPRRRWGGIVFVIAKIERAGALDHYDAILAGRRRHHGGPRRPRRGDPHRADRDHPEGPDRPRQPRRQADHHRDADARVDGVEPPADARRGDRRRQRDPRRHRLRDAVGRVGDGPVPRGGGRDARGDCRRDRAAPGRGRAEPGARLLPRPPPRNDGRSGRDGRRTRARHRAVRRRVRPDAHGRHRPDAVALQAGRLDRRRERRSRRLPGPGVLVRRLGRRRRRASRTTGGVSPASGWMPTA